LALGGAHRTLGGFAIDLACPDEGAKQGAEAPDDLLRLLAAWGGRQVDARRVTGRYGPGWRREGRDALKAMLHRARMLL